MSLDGRPLESAESKAQVDKLATEADADRATRLAEHKSFVRRLLKYLRPHRQATLATTSATDSGQDTDKVQATTPAKTDSTEGTPPKPPLTLEDWAKLGAASVVLCYGVGLVVVNAFLLPYGVTDFNLFRARFIFTGLLVLAVIGIATACVSISITFIYTFWRRPKWLVKPDGSTRKVDRVVEAIVTWDFLAMAIILLAVPYFIFYFPLHQTRTASVEGYFVSIVCGGCILLAWFFASMSREKKTPAEADTNKDSRKSIRRIQAPPSWTMYGLIAFFFVPYVFWTMSYFAQQVFPRVPTQLGGAQAQQVHLLISPDSVAGLQKLGISVSEKSAHVTGVINLLFTGENFYVIRSNGRVFILRSDDVMAVNPTTTFYP